MQSNPEPRAFHNLALIGFMGTGKSTIGRAVAHQLTFEFVDTDHLVEREAGMLIAYIFERFGEPAFREMERRVVLGLRDARRTVIATGGGLPTSGDNLALLKEHSLVVCLWASPETIWERVGHQTHRPLLQHADAQTRIRELLAQREAFYRQADVLVSTDHRSSREVAQQVLHQFSQVRAPDGTSCEGAD